MNKNKLYQAALLSLMGLASAATAQAQTAYNGDLMVGFTQGSGNDFIYDLGAGSSLTNGETWNLAASLSTAGMTVDAASWGVIGSIKIGSTGYAWSTVPVGNPTPALLVSTPGWAGLYQPTKSIYQNFSTAGAGQSLLISYANENSWNTQTINPVNSEDYVNAYGNPNVSGATAASLYETVANNSAPVLIGSFTLNESGVLTYNVTPSVATPQIVGISRQGNVSTVSFTTANGPTYTLYYTNASGLTAPVATWPSVTTTVAGNGLTNSIPDTTTDAIRFYRVGAH